MGGDDQEPRGRLDHALEYRVPDDHPLREVRELVDRALSGTPAGLGAGAAGTGEPPIPPERLLRALLLQVFYSIRSERMLLEQLNYNLLFRWFAGLELSDRVWNDEVFSESRNRLLKQEWVRSFFAEVKARLAGLVWDEHFTVDGTLIEAWASNKCPPVSVPENGAGNMPIDYGSFAASVPQVFPRWFSSALLLTALLVSIPLIVLGRSQFIGYDGFWHIFMSNLDNWRMFWLEMKGDAHPPIFYLLLHYLIKLGHNLLMYRLLVIVPGIATAWAIGKITAKLTTRPALGLLAAMTYGLSASMIEINTDVRSYSLALLFITLAFGHLIDFLRDPGGWNKRYACVWFSVCTGLAIGTEYYSIFFYGASLFLISALALRYRPFKGQLLGGIRRHRVMRTLVFFIPAIEFAIFYYFHASRQVLEYSEFHWNTEVHKTIREFVSVNLVREWNYLLPIHATSAGLVATLVGGALIVVVYAAFFRKFSFRNAADSAPGLILFALLFELIVLAIVKKYPFGGELRQQSILAPFVVLTAFSALDPLLNRFSRWANVGVWLVAVFIAVHFYSTWKTYPRYTVHDYVGPQADAFWLAIPHPRAIYIDQYSLIWYFMYTHQSRWRFVRRLGNGGRIDGVPMHEFRIRDASGTETPLLRAYGIWNFEFEQPDFYRLLVGSLREAHIGTIDLFHVTQVPKTRDAAALAKFEEQIVQQAAAVGLDVTRRSINNDHVFAEFELKSP